MSWRSNLRLPSREDADTQIRRRLRELSADCLLPTFRCQRFWDTARLLQKANRKAKDQQIVPHGIPSDPQLLTDTVPMSWWSCDVLQDDGQRRFRSLVTEIEQVCEAPECELVVDLINEQLTSNSR
jgi:hypothetical protein